MNSKHNIKVLVNLYEQHPCLYDVNSADYHTRSKRQIALKTICDKFEELVNVRITPNDFKKKINSLRTQYIEQIVKIKKSKLNGDQTYQPSWWLFDCLKFLDPHITQKKGESSITESENKIKIERVYHLELEPTPSSSSSYETSIPDNKKGTFEEKSQNEFWSTATDAIQTLSEKTIKEDGLYYWCKYIEAKLREIKDPRKLNLIQKHIVQIIDDNNDY